uniref:DNA repair protein RecO n=1 Tax=Nitratidesulfovibrio vulgaris (strain DSM 19637 / Miyazaki F) TaxID=883 RepID=B8DPF9_NITV9
MEFSEQVLIVRTGRFREADLWVRFLSPTRGLLTAFAFGGCRSRKRFCGCLDLFNRSLLRIKSTRGGQYLSIQEGTLLRGPDRLRRDWPRFGAAVNCLKFLEALGCGPEGAAATHQLVEDVLELLEGGGPVPDMLPVLFRLRLTAEQGYAPRLDSCASCGADLTHAAGAAFLVQEGVAQCDACAPLPGPRVRVEREALDVLRFVQENSPLLWPGVLPPAPGMDGVMPEQGDTPRMFAAMTPSVPHLAPGGNVPEAHAAMPDASGAYETEYALLPPDMSPRADSARNGFAGGASPRFMDGRFLGSLSGLAFGDGGHGSLDDCLCRLPDSALADSVRADGVPPDSGQTVGTASVPQPPREAPRPLWNGSMVFESDPFGPVLGSEDMGATGMGGDDGAAGPVARQQEISGAGRGADVSVPQRPSALMASVADDSARGVNRVNRASPASPADLVDLPGPVDLAVTPDAVGTQNPADARNRAAVRRQCTRAVEGFIQFHIGLAWDNGRFRRL